MGPTLWADPLLPIFFEDQIKKIKAQLVLGPIDLAHLASLG